jgi:hypothetical protein
MAPVYELVTVLAFDDTFLAALEQIRNGSDADHIARRYVWRDSRPRRVIRRVLEQSAASRWPAYPSQPVLELAVHGVTVGDRLEPDDPTQWPHAKRHGEAAAMLARMGAGRCVRCGALLAADGARRRYCSPCEPADWAARSDREVITGLLNAVGDALGVD